MLNLSNNPLLSPSQTNFKGCYEATDEQKTSLRKRTWVRVYDNLPERVGDLTSAGVPHKLCRRVEIPMAHAHYSDFLPFPILVEDPVNPPPVWTLTLREDTRHVLHRAGADFLAPALRRIGSLGASHLFY